MKINFYLIPLFLVFFQPLAMADDVSGIPSGILKTYTNLRIAISSKDYDKFKSLYHPASNFSLPDREDFAEYGEDLLNFFPDINSYKIVKVKSENNLYGFIYLEEYEELGHEYISLNLIRFVKVEQIWRVYGYTSTVSFDKTGSKEDVKKRISEEIENNETLKIDS